MSDNFPGYLPKQRPKTGLIDPDQIVSHTQKAKLDNEISNLSYSAYVILLPKQDNSVNVPQLVSSISKNWELQSNSFLFVVNLNDRSLGFYASSDLRDQGVDEQFFDQYVLPAKFYPQIKKGKVAHAIDRTLATVDFKITNQSKSLLKTKTESTSSYSKEHHDYHANQLFNIAGVLFVAIVILIVIAMRFKGKSQEELNLRKSQAEYKKKMEDLKRLFENNPTLYFQKIVFMVFLGYLYIGVSFLVLASVTLFTIILLIKMPYLAFKLGLPLLILLGVILRAFWINVPEVPGRPLNKKDCPKLFETVNEIRKTINAPPVHAIHLVNELNAAVYQRPRLGLFGWHKNHLMIGMELLNAFSYDQVRAILAHEMGHLAGNHGARSAWIYRIQDVWDKLMLDLNRDQSFATLLFTRFFNWYVPELESYTFLYRRKNEYNADLCSLDVVDAETAALALLGSKIKSGFLDSKYWVDVNENYSKPTPPSRVYRGISSAIQNRIEKHNAEVWLREAMSVETDYEDSHPCVKDRVAAILNIKPEEVSEYAHRNLDKLIVLDDCAFEVLFEDKAEELGQQVDREWQESVREYWTLRHEYYLKTKEEFNQLLEKRNSGVLTNEEAITFAYSSLTIEGFESAKPHFEYAIEKNPVDAEIIQTFGEWLLNSRDPDGVIQLEKAMHLDRMRIYNCSQLLYGYYKSKNEEDKASYYEGQVLDWLESYYRSSEERNELTESDEFYEHDLKDDDISYVIEQFKLNPLIVGAWLVCKKLKSFPDMRFYAIVLKVKPKVGDSDEIRIEVTEEVVSRLEFPGEYLLISWKYAPSSLKSACQSVNGAVLF